MIVSRMTGSRQISAAALFCAVSLGGAATARAHDDLDARVKSATVRVKVSHGHVVEYGSGAIVDRKGSQALVVTCAHVFEDTPANRAVQVTLFDGHATRHLRAALLAMDLERDVALLRIAADDDMRAIPLASASYRVQVGQEVVVAGCDLGGEPSARRTRVTALNRFYGRPNLEVAAVPREGRSGGALVTADGHLVGICHGINTIENEGIYSAVAAVHQLAGLNQWVDAKAVAGKSGERPHRDRDPEAVDKGAMAAAPITAIAPERPSSEMEVICILRPKNGAETSKILVLKEPSEVFLRALHAEESVRR